MSPSTRTTRLRKLLQLAATFVAFAFANRLGWYFQIENGVSVFFPATAVDVIACMSFGWVGATGVFLGTLITPWQPKDETWKLVVSALLNVSEGMIPYLVFRMRRRLSQDLSDIGSFGAFVMFGAVVNSLFSAILGTALLIPQADTPLAHARQIFMWWVSDFSAALLLATPVLAYGRPVLNWMRGEKTVATPRTVVNAIEIAVVIILVGWFSSTMIRTHLLDSIDTERIEEQGRWEHASRLLTVVDHDVAEQIASGRQPASEIMNALEKFRPYAVQYPDVRARYDELELAVQDALVGGDRLSSDQPPVVRIEEKLIALRGAMTEANRRQWKLFEAKRDRIKTVALVMDLLVLLILILTSANLVATLSRPMEHLYLAVAAMRSGEPFSSAPVESSFVEISTLARTIESRSRELLAREEALRQQTAKAVAASRAKSEFLARMSHELRTPLNSIVGFSDLLLTRSSAIDPVRRRLFLGNIMRSGKNLLRLVNDLLDIAKIEAGKMSFFYEPVDLRMIVVNSVMAARPQMSERHQEIETDLPDQPIIVRADTARLEQVVSNLLSNANKFSYEGGRIRVSAHKDGDSCEIVVRDQGVGIRVEDHARIFDDFEQVDTPDLKLQGAGLGLSLARRFVHAHGGTIALESAFGSGAVFRVRLPLLFSESATAPGEAAAGM